MVRKTTFLLCLLCCTLIWGCAGMGGAIALSAAEGAFLGAAISDLMPLPAPKTVCSAKDSVAVKYRSRNAESKRAEAMQLILDHCSGKFEKTDHVDDFGSHVVYAACLREDGLKPDKPTCTPVVRDPSPAGFGEEELLP